jgi:hypothetical protein
LSPPPAANCGAGGCCCNFVISFVIDFADTLPFAVTGRSREDPGDDFFALLVGLRPTLSDLLCFFAIVIPSFVRASWMVTTRSRRPCDRWR